MRSGFYENTSVYAEDFATAFSGIITNGVLIANDETALHVSAVEDMTIAVAPGRCWIEGHFGVVESAEKLTLSLADGTYDRIDRIIVRNDMRSGKAEIKVIEGTAATTPVPPEIVRDGTYFDICLAEITIPGGTLSVDDSMIVDKRTDGELCGICQSTVADIDVEELFSRYETILHDMSKKNQKLFNDWFANLQNQLDQNQAANLQKQIDELKKSAGSFVADNGTVLRWGCDNVGLYVEAAE